MCRDISDNTSNLQEMASHETRQKKGFNKTFYKAGNLAGNYSLKPEPTPPVSTMTSKSRSWLLLRKLSSRPEIKRVDTEKKINVIKEGGGAGGVVVEARRSVSHVETNLASVVAFLQVKVMVSDMPGFMQVHAFRCARRTYDSLEKFSSKHMAYNMKKEFDQVYGPAWHCIVGSSFGSFVTHATGGFLYFSMEKLYILLFKTNVQRALDD